VSRSWRGAQPSAPLDDGTRTLVLVADDNFNPEGGQHTMFHVLAVR
jgi:3-phytase